MQGGVRLLVLGLLIIAAILWPSGALAQHPPPVSSSVNFSFSIPFPTGDLRLTGYASPGALVTFLRNSAVVGTTVANGSSYFDKTLTGFNPGVQTFSLYGSDVRGRNTLTLSFDVNIISGSTITLGDFLLPPTVTVAKTELKRPDAQSGEGYAKNQSTVTNFFNSDTITKQATADGNGFWRTTVPEIFHLGDHTSYALVQDSLGNQSQTSGLQQFHVVLSADLNVDSKVNLTDFSILMFSYGVDPPPNLASDINDNGGKPDLVDFSIMMFFWTN